MYALLAGFHKQVLQIQQRLLRRIHVDEGGRDTRLPASSGTTDLMHIIFDFFGHGEDDNVLDVVEVQSLGGDS